ncbi:MAG: hypothetical protein ACRD3D_06225 [Terriglobia bacterium]
MAAGTLRAILREAGVDVNRFVKASPLAWREETTRRRPRFEAIPLLAGRKLRLPKATGNSP